MSSEILDFFMNHTKEMSIAFDEKGVITHANAATCTALDYKGGLNGMHICEVFPGSFERTEDGFDTELLCGEEKTVTIYRNNTTCFYVRLSLYRSDIPGMAYVCLMIDVSNEIHLERQIAQVKQEAEEAAKVKSEFVANVTHELRTPVNGILGNTRILLEKIQEGELMNTLRLIERGCADMNSIINNILDFSKLEAGKFTLEYREFDFRGMIDYVKSNHMPKVAEKGLQFFVTVSPQIPKRIIGDELRIVQILNNFLSNACKFTSVGKISLEVILTAHKENRIELFFIVNDTGIGIDKADKDKLFKSFSQVDASVSRKYGGTGLGLNISKQLVNLMGGDINVESEKNKGSSFTFSMWAEIPSDEVDEVTDQVEEKTVPLFESMDESIDQIYIFGTAENKKELQDKMSKLVLAVEMGNWEKAEQFMEVVRQLTESAPHEIKSPTLRLKMAVQKEDYDKTIQAHQVLNDLLI